jgi:hypothetical protein
MSKSDVVFGAVDNIFHVSTYSSSVLYLNFHICYEYTYRGRVVTGDKLFIFAI